MNREHQIPTYSKNSHIAMNDRKHMSDGIHVVAATLPLEHNRCSPDFVVEKYEIHQSDSLLLVASGL